MKFNKSHILLISLISIFLLLSLGAASAAEDMDNQFVSDSVSDIAIDDIDDISDIDNNMNDKKLTQGEDTETYTDDEVNEGGDSGEEDLIDTTIEAENETFKYGDKIKIPVSVKDNESNNISIVKEDLNVSNGTHELNFTLDDESNIVLNQFRVGEYTLFISFLGNATYKASQTEVNLNITQTNTAINVSDVKVKVGENITIPFVIKIENNKTLNFTKSNLTVYYGDEEINFTKVDGGIKLLNFTPEIGNYSILIKYAGNNNCNGSNATFTLSILANNTIKAENVIKVNNHTQNVTIPIVIINEIFDNETSKTNVTNFTVTQNDLILLFTYFNGTENVTDVLANDQYNLTGEPGNYTISFFTDKLDNSTLTIIFANGTFNETNKTMNLIGYLNAVIIPGIVSADYQDGKFTFQLVDSDTNEPLSNTTITVRGVNFYNFDNGTSISPSKEFTSDENGYITIDNINMNVGYDFSSFFYNYTSLPAGKYNLTFKGNDSLSLENTTEITVNKVKVKIVASNYKQLVNSGVKYTFKVVNANNNKVIKLTAMQFKVKIGGNYTVFNTTTNMSGQSSFNINLIPGLYPILITTNSANVVKATVKRNLTVVKRTGILNANNRTILYGSAPTAIIRFTDKNTGKAIVNGIVKVRLYTTSKKYIDLAFLTNKTGHVKFNAALAVGKHKMIISSIDTNYTATSLTRYVTVKKTTGKFTAPNLSTYYRSGKIYSIKLTNTKNKAAMYGASVNIKVYISKNKYYNYTGVTAGDGKVNLKVSYKPGTYKVVISPNDKGYTASSITRKITVSKNPINMTPTSLKVKKGQYFRVKVTSAKDKKALSSVSVKVKVYTGSAYKTYTIKTNAKGIASLKISQSVGKHKVVISNVATKLYTGKAVTKTLTVTK